MARRVRRTRLTRPARAAPAPGLAPARLPAAARTASLPGPRPARAPRLPVPGAHSLRAAALPLPLDRADPGGVRVGPHRRGLAHRAGRLDLGAQGPVGRAQALQRQHRGITLDANVGLAGLRHGGLQEVDGHQRRVAGAGIEGWYRRSCQGESASAHPVWRRLGRVERGGPEGCCVRSRRVKGLLQLNQNVAQPCVDALDLPASSNGVTSWPSSKSGMSVASSMVWRADSAALSS